MDKINGFSRKPHPYQIISYIFFFGVTVTYFFLVLPLSSNIAKIVGGIIEVISGTVVVTSGYLATTGDPSDPYVKMFRKARLENKSYTPPTREFYCGADHTYVKTGSKHCRRCNRCTEGFDHHCKWINNDVGKENYSVMVFLTGFIVFAIILTVNYGIDHELLDNDISIYSNDSNQILSVMIVIWIFLVPSIVFLILDVNLVLFHIYLSHKGLTTYQYITAVEQKKEYMKELKEGIAALEGEKRTCLDFVLCLKKKRPTNQHNQTVGDLPKNLGLEFPNMKDDPEKNHLSNVQKENKVAADETHEDQFVEGPSKTKIETKFNEIMTADNIKSPAQDENLYPLSNDKSSKKSSDRDDDHMHGSQPIIVNIGNKIEPNDQKSNDKEIKMATEKGSNKVNKKQFNPQLPLDLNNQDDKILSAIKTTTPPFFSQQRMSAYSVESDHKELDGFPIKSDRNFRTSNMQDSNMRDEPVPNSHSAKPIKKKLKGIHDEKNAISNDIAIMTVRGAEL